MLIFSIIFIAGTFAGSFFYTLAQRYINGLFSSNPLKALFSRSKCDSCNNPINLVSLIPIAGYLIIAGKCKSCGKKISISYPLWELFFGLLALAVFYIRGYSLMTVFVYLICSVVIAIAIVDYKTMIVPPSLVLALLLLSLYPVFTTGNIINNIYGFILLTVFFLLMLFIFPGAFGGGDIKLYMVAGFLLGLEMSIVLLEISLISGALFGTIYALAKGGNFRLKIPFAPFIAFGIIITLLFGASILLFYYNSFLW
ncbi:MAG TPA: prepilin peptidase [Spirochaetota bacterium]|nr:prepilin peptidase [Spirochaetota bacterium]